MELVHKNILITGSTGFIGANLLRYLVYHYNAFFHIIIRNTSNMWRIKDLLKNKRNIKYYYIDLLDKNKLLKLFKTLRPEILYHCATYGMYLKTETDKERIYETNIKSLINLIVFSKDFLVQRFINTGTTSEYGSKNEPMAEDMLLEPNNTYGCSKACATILASQLAKEYSLNLITLRLFSPYGYYEKGTRLIPTLMLNYINQKPPHLSSRTFVRDFTFIEDIISAYIQAIKKDNIEYGEIFNVGTGKQYSIEDVTRTIKKIADSNIEPVWDKKKPDQAEPKFWLADINKIKKLLNWVPKYSLQKGLQLTYQWFQKNKKLYQ
jgi:nucleoside-diphosphate-sugar epimerase